VATTPPVSTARIAAFQGGLRELGYTDGRNVAVEVLSWGGQQALAAGAAELVRSSPAVIVAESNAAVLALKQATSIVPIVMAVVGDPVGSGLVASLARPGTNITGLSNTAEQLSGKRLELLKEMVPRLARVAVLRNPANPTHAILLRETEAAGASLGLTLVPVDFEREADLETGFAVMARERTQAVVVLPQPAGVAIRAPLIELAARHRLPVVFPSPEPVEAGGLMAYGPSHTALWGRAATYVDRILRGARPADLPVEQPTRFELVLNLRTARALGLAVPQAVRLRADRLIE
jgi:putative ABC transport system substrate-binding protein